MIYKWVNREGVREFSCCVISIGFRIGRRSLELLVYSVGFLEGSFNLRGCGLFFLSENVSFVRVL